MSSTLTSEITTVIQATRLFKAVILDGHNLIPKIAADKVVSAVMIEGDGTGIGSVRQYNFSPAMPYSYEQRRLEFQDVENCEMKLSVVGGGGLGIFFDSASYHVKFVPHGTGSLAKMVCTYTPTPGANSTQLENMIKGTFQGAIKGCEAFLLGNPDAYN